MLLGIILRARYAPTVPRASISQIAHKDAIPIVHDSVPMLYRNRTMLVNGFQMS